jgi:hypothetical protein
MNEKILGYCDNGQPIYEPEQGYIYTAACISCVKCRTIISGMGGPKPNSLCVPCFESLQKEKNT